MTEEKKKIENGKLEAASITVQSFKQSPGLCGPASLKILLSHFGKTYSEQQLKDLSNATCDAGTEHEGMIQAIKAIGGYAFMKDNGTIEELAYFIKKEKLPVIIGWFDKDGDHYSVVVNITEKNVIIADPAVNEPERWIDREMFPHVWFDFVGFENKVVSWGWYLVATFEKRKFDVQAGYYY
jgi:ABC-type bacteriocin/lantibiotic exporter with double-glycine peptidase domain